MADEIKQFIEPGKKNLYLIYILYLLGNLTTILPLVGVVFAFVHMGHENPFLKTHYQFAFRTFVIGVIAFVASLILSVLLSIISLGLGIMSMVLYVAIFVWFVLRGIFAAKLIVENRPHPAPFTLWIK